jgi:hypothetical protein
MGAAAGLAWYCRGDDNRGAKISIASQRRTLKSALVTENKLQHDTPMITPKRLAVAGTVVLVLAMSGWVGAQVKQGKSRPMKTSYLMKGIMKPQCDALKKGLDTAPKDDKEWISLAVHAAVLNEVSYLLMDDGRCPDAVWADAASKTLRQGSADVLKAVEGKDLAAAKNAFGAMTKACKACHDQHKEK